LKNAVKGAKMHLKTKDVASFAIKNHQICKESCCLEELGVEVKEVMMAGCKK
jgi:hypothetical protein